MAGGIDWFRWHHGSVNDQKFRLIAKKAGARVADVVAVWACLLEEASSAEDRGNAGSPDFESIDEAMGLDDGISQAIYRQMQERDLIDADGRIVAWERRQPKREREGDSSTERVRAFRERQRHETPRNATERQDEPSNANASQETPRVEERRVDKKEREPRATRLADSWTLPEDWKAFCVSERPDLDPDFTAKRFADYWHGKPGKDGRKLDWLATWRNWVRGERTGPNAAPGGHTVPSRAADETARYLAERREQEQHATLPPPDLLAKVRGAVKTEAA